MTVGGVQPVAKAERKDTSMTVETILSELAAHVKALGEQVRGRTDLSIGEAVVLVAPVVRRLGGALVAWLCALGRRWDRADCPECGQPMQPRGQRPRWVTTLFGAVKLNVPRLRCKTCGHESAPLLERSELRCSCTPEVWQEVLEDAVAQPYRKVEERLARFGIEVSDSTVEALVHEVGGELAMWEKEVGEATACGTVSHRAERRPERLYLSVDARSVRVAGEWRELKVGVIYESAARELDGKGEPPPIERLSSYACFGSAEEFLERFAVEMERRGVFQAREVVLIADGAEWIWERLPSLVPMGRKTVQILDFYHAAENLGKAVNAVYGEGSAEGRRLFERLRKRLKVGDRKAVVQVLEQLRERARGDAARRVVNNVLAYVRRHWERMSYFQLRCDGYHIGSGPVESQCKRLGQRVKGPGMNWQPEGLAALLAVDNQRQRQRLAGQTWARAA